jgi:2-iminobutanoate/2-iminopropanoate deaminase
MKAINTDYAPKAVGPYSQATLKNNTLFVSGQLGIDPETNELAPDFDTQAEQVFSNLHAILTEAEFSFDDVMKVSVFLDDIKNFAALNAIYARYFTEPYPAREALEVSALPKGGLVEISLIAMK